MKKNKVTKFINITLIIAVYSFVFIILVERVNIAALLFGIAISIGAILVTNRYLLKESYQSLFDSRILGFLLYFVILFYNIIVSGIHAVYLTIYGKVQLDEIRYFSTIESEFGLTLLANSITMTPGTVTVSLEDGELHVLQLCKQGEDADAKDIASMEKNIIRFVLNN